MKRKLFVMLLFTSCFLTGCTAMDNYGFKVMPKLEDVVSDERLAEVQEIKARFQNYQDNLICPVCDGTEFINSSTLISYGDVSTKYGSADIKICKRCGHIELFQSFSSRRIMDEEYSFDEWNISE